MRPHHARIKRNTPARIIGSIAHARAAMAAHVVVRMEPTGFAPNKQHALTRDIEHAVIAGPGHVFLARGAEPLAAENGRAVRRESLGSEVSGTFERLFHPAIPFTPRIGRLPCKRTWGTQPVPIDWGHDTGNGGAV